MLVFGSIMFAVGVVLLIITLAVENGSTKEKLAFFIFVFGVLGGGTLVSGSDRQNEEPPINEPLAVVGNSLGHPVISWVVKNDQNQIHCHALTANELGGGLTLRQMSAASGVYYDGSRYWVSAERK